MALMWLIALTAAAPGALAADEELRETPSLAVGIGTFVRGQAMVQARGEARLSRISLLEPQLAVLFPRSSREGAFSLEWLVNLDAARRLGPRGLASVGMGAHFQTLVSEGRNVTNSGDFVTPSGSALTWLFTANLGAGYWVDSRLRVDAGAAVARLFDNARRRFQYQVGVAYAL